MKTGYLIVLPFPPSVNDYYGMACNAKRPRKFIKTKGEQYRIRVQEIIQSKDLELRANVPLSVSITLTPKDNRVHDIDNVLKCLFDSLTHAHFWQDDSFVRKLSMDYAPEISKEGSVLLHVEAL